MRRVYLNSLLDFGNFGNIEEVNLKFSKKTLFFYSKGLNFIIIATSGLFVKKIL